MESNGSVQDKEEAQAVISKSTAATSMKMKLLDHFSLCIPVKEEPPLNRPQHHGRLLDYFIRGPPSKDWFFKVTGSPFSYVKRLGSLRSNSSPHSATGAGSGCRSFRVPFGRKIYWKSLLADCKNWAKHPMNTALLVWLFFVAVGLVVLFLFMAGLMDDAVPERSERKRWTEITNQILNALFTIMCLYQHPRLFHHLFLLCRWRPDDAAEMRMAYCKSDAAARRPYERAHMLLVVALLHVTCLSQYALCGLYWGYSLDARPSWPQFVLIASGIVAPVTAGIYVVYGPLGRKKQPGNDEAVPHGQIVEQVQGQSRTRVATAEPEWAGGLFDCSDDVTVGVLSFFCTFGVFGWNMERLGFGNMYVHIVTFLLLCAAPLLVFSVTAIHIDDDAARYVTGAAGVVLCFCGLLYGGFWRMQMRKRFKLPANTVCCGHPAAADFAQWLFCWPCALAQEVRTGNSYDVEENSFYSKEREGEEERWKLQRQLQPLAREGETRPVMSPKSSKWAERGAAGGDGFCCVRVNAEEEGDKITAAPLPLPPLFLQQEHTQRDQLKQSN